MLPLPSTREASVWQMTGVGSDGCNVLHSSFQPLQAGFYPATVPRQIPLSQPSYKSLVFTQRRVRLKRFHGAVHIPRR